MNREVDASEAQSVTVGRFARMMKAYRVPILISLAAVFTGYVIIAALLLLLSPTLTVTSLPFRLTFEGAEKGRYPNDMVFSSTEIVAQPILERVWASNNLGEYMPLDVFQKSVYVLESNPALEQLSSDYQSRLADPKLSPIDRERLIREFETKKASIGKSEYSLNFSPAYKTSGLPDALSKKVLYDVLREWANYATRNQRVLQYSIAVMSPNTVPPVSDPSMNYIARLLVLRSNTFRVMHNIDQIRDLPGGTLARTGKDQLSLADIRTQLEDLVRFRLEPFVPVIRASGLVPNLSDVIRFCEMQLAYDERQLATARETAQVVRQALLTYSNITESGTGGETPTVTPTQPGGDGQGSPNVTPFVAEGFLDRLMDLSQQVEDAEFRQEMIDDYRTTAGRLPTLQSAVNYDQEVLARLRAATPGTSTITAQQAELEINAMHREVHEALKKVNELYLTISKNLAPDTHMFAPTAVPTVRTERRVDPIKLLALGILLLFLAFPMIIAGVLIHNRVRQEEEIDEEHAHTTAVA